MATLVFTALGTAIGGPLGGAVGSLIGNQLDRAVIGGGRTREGPRLKELAVTTSSYGMPVARHFGAMRVAGTIIWATDLIETSETNGGAKGAAATRTYSYSCSFAVALASRPIRRIGRIWADGNLLRGAAGDLKVGGTLRVYTGHGDQAPDPLIEADRGGACPAFRDFAYCVFESLQLADFGNRVPALSFEIVADDGEITVEQLLSPLEETLAVRRPLAGLAGMSDEGGSLLGTLSALDQLYPLACDAGGGALSIFSGDAVPPQPVMLPPAAVDESEHSFGGASGTWHKRQADRREAPGALRYYEVARDYQVGVQHADGRASPERNQTIEFPGTFDAMTARALVNAAGARAQSARETRAWRVAELDPAIGPGAVVTVPGRSGIWRVESWEWREHGIELELRRLPVRAAPPAPVDAGEVLAKVDQVAGPTQLAAFELPWDGEGPGDTRQIFAAASSASAGWTGAALYLEREGELIPLGSTGRRRSIIGLTSSALPPSSSLLLERGAILDIELASPDFALDEAGAEALANGANRAVVGDEVLQFSTAQRIDGIRWRVGGLLRGRGGTEWAAASGQTSGRPFILLDDKPVRVDPPVSGVDAAVTLAAIGLADPEPVIDSVTGSGSTARPLTPVHLRSLQRDDGTLELCWTRRARGAWAWVDGVDVPLNEEAERYIVGLGDVDAPVMRWEVTAPSLNLPASTFAQMASAYPGQPLWVRQIGRVSRSPASLLATLPSH